MRASLKKEIALYCYSYVSTFFAEMHNPRYRGPNFRWENFPSLVSNSCKVSIPFQIIDNKVGQEEIQEQAEEFALEIATRLVKLMTE